MAAEPAPRPQPAWRASFEMRAPPPDSLKTVTLTPGPLVIALRPDNVPVGHNWPPTATSIETIAASYVPTQSGTAGVRLFNLSPVSPCLDPAENGRSEVAKHRALGHRTLLQPA